MKKITFTILVVLSITVTDFSTRLFAEGKHEQSYAKSNDQSHSDAHWASPKQASERTNPIKNDNGSTARGAKSFALLCVSCHGEKALGDGIAGVSLDPKPTGLKAMSGDIKMETLHERLQMEEAQCLLGRVS